MCYARARRRVGLETIGRNLLAALLARAVGAIVHFLEGIFNVFVPELKLLDERYIGRQFLYLISRINGISFLALKSGRRSLPIPRLAPSPPMTREIFFHRILFRLEGAAEFVELVLLQMLHKNTVLSVTYKV